MPYLTMKEKPDFLDFESDHNTILLDPPFYNVFYIILRTVFGVPGNRDGIIYDVQKEWKDGHKESMTYAVKLGGVWKERDQEMFEKFEQYIKNIQPITEDYFPFAFVPKTLLHEIYEYFKQKREADMLRNLLFAFVQPSEPDDMTSHVRTMLKKLSTSFHVQHHAIKTSNLKKFYDHAQGLGVNFVTPILYDDKDDLIQVFTGELYHPKSKESSAYFFEVVERKPNPEMRREATENREKFFRDKTFLSLYGAKEEEYRKNSYNLAPIEPFIDFELYEQLYHYVGKMKHWEITEHHVIRAEEMMREYASRKT